MKAYIPTPMLWVFHDRCSIAVVIQDCLPTHPDEYQKTADETYPDHSLRSKEAKYRINDSSATYEGMDSFFKKTF